MRWYESLLLSLGVSFLTSVLFLFLFTSYFVKTADVVSIISRFENKLEEKVYEGILSPKDAQKLRKKFLRYLELSIQRERGIVLTKQAVLKGVFGDATKNIENRLSSFLYADPDFELLYQGRNK